MHLTPPPWCRYQSILVFNERLKEHMTWADVLGMMSLSSEFENIMVRWAAAAAAAATTSAAAQWGQGLRIMYALHGMQCMWGF